MHGMRLWRKAVPLAPVSSSTRFLSAQAQSSVEYSARIHKATLLESAMSLTNGQLRPPQSCGRASVARSTMGRRLLPSGSFHKNSVMFLSNRHSACDGAGGAESTSSTVGRIMVRTLQCFYANSMHTGSHERESTDASSKLVGWPFFLGV